MAKLTRDDFIQQTSGLLTESDRTEVSLSDILNSCGAQKGSLYHFFPNGKDELVTATVEHLADCAFQHNSERLESAASTADGVHRLVTDLAKWVDDPACSFAIPFTAIAALTSVDNEKVRLACKNALDRLEELYRLRLRKDGMPARESSNLASFIVVTIEGAFLLSRTHRTSKPLRNIATNLRRIITDRVGESRAS